MISAKEALKISVSVDKYLTENLYIIEEEIRNVLPTGRTEIKLFLGIFPHQCEVIRDYLINDYGYKSWLTQIKHGDVIHVSWGEENE